MQTKISSKDRITLLRFALQLPEGSQTRRAILSGLSKVGMEFSSEEAFNSYMDEHPGADPRNHWVKEKPRAKSKPEEGEGDIHQETKPEQNSSTVKPPKGARFTEEELALPSSHNQPISDPKKLFEQAEEAHEQQLSWLNHGEGLDKTLGAKVIRGDQGKSDVDYSQPGPIILIGPMKKMERSEEKVTTDFGGDWSRLGDIVRASIAVDSMDEIDDVLDKLRESGLKLVRRPKDRFSNPTEGGYRDMLMNVQYPNGHIGELQLHLKPILEAKGKAHKLYEETRSISARAQKEGRDYLTDEEQSKIDEANEKMKKLYSDAYEKATGGKGEKAQKAARYTRRASKVHFFEFQDMPAKLEFKKFPVVYRDGKPTVEYDLQEFFSQANPLEEEDYKELLQAQGPKSSKKKALNLDWTDFLT